MEIRNDTTNSFCVNGISFIESDQAPDGLVLDPSAISPSNIKEDSLIYVDTSLNDKFISTSFPEYSNLEPTLKSLLLVHFKTLSEYEVNMYTTALR